MTKAELIYHMAVSGMAIVFFFMKITVPNDIFQFFLRAVGKIVPLFCMLYAGVQIFKHFGIL